MTLVELKTFYEKHGPWIIRGVVLLVFITLAWSWNNARSERAELEKKVERLELEKKGLATEQEAKQRDLDKLSRQLWEHDAEWRAHIKGLEKMLGETPKVIRVVEYVSKPTEVTKPPEARPCPTDGKAIVLLEGDKMHAELKETDFGTDAGNTVMTGRISCVRDTPSPMVLHTELIKAPGPKVLTLPTDPPYRWGAGVFGSATKSGWALGPKVLFPPVDVKLFWLWPMRLETELGVAIGGGGERLLQGGVAARFR